MSFVIWLGIGGAMGWLASRIMCPGDKNGAFLNVAVGIVGTLVGGWLVSPVVGISTIDRNSFSVASMLVTLAGAAILLAVINLFQHGTLRQTRLSPLLEVH